MFRDRADAGERLARAVAPLLEGPAVVLGIPRGGVIVAAPVAAALRAPLDVVLTHKLGAPGNPELAIGAVAPGVRVVSERAVRMLGVDAAYLDDEVARQEEELERRAAAYRSGREPPAFDGGTAVVVDDGVATGATAVAALRWARAQGAARVLFAAPVGPEGIERQLAHDCDACVILETPADLRAVGSWYREFGQTTDAQVMRALEEGRV
jgi:putative phosphoribosyl transferase